MDSESSRRIHWSFWVIGAVALIWNILGAVNFFVQMNPEMLAAYRESERLIVESRPVWATCTFALAVFAGTLGCAALLLRRSAAYILLVASFVGVIGTMIHTLSVGIDFGVGEILGIILMPLVLGALLIWYSKFCERRGWLDH